MKLNLLFKNDIFSLSINEKDTLGILKSKISELFSLPKEELNIYFKDTFLWDEKKTIRELKINENDTIILKKKNLKIIPKENNNLTKDILKNPFLKNALNDPESMKNMIKFVPGLEKQMKKNPEMKRIFNNPNTIQEIKKMTEDPDYYDYQLKNIDLAMSKLENLPGGFNMMNSFTKEFVNPFSFLGKELKLNSQEEKKSMETEIIKNVWNEQKNKKNLLIFYRKEIMEIKKYGFTDLNLICNCLSEAEGDIEIALALLNERL